MTNDAEVSYVDSEPLAGDPVQGGASGGADLWNHRSIGAVDRLSIWPNSWRHRGRANAADDAGCVPDIDRGLFWIVSGGGVPSGKESSVPLMAEDKPVARRFAAAAWAGDAGLAGCCVPRSSFLARCGSHAVSA